MPILFQKNREPSLAERVTVNSNVFVKGIEYNIFWKLFDIFLFSIETTNIIF